MFKKVLKRMVQAIFLNRIVWQFQNENNSVHITFDDGPDIANTPKILDILKKHEIKAFFFVVGKQAENNKDILKEIVSQGHVLGNHSYLHKPVKFLTVKAYIQDINKCNKILNKIFDTSSHKFVVRPPYGYLNPIATLVLLLQGYKIMMWTHDSHDSIVSSAKELLDEIDKIKFKSGDIILLHDDYGHTVEALDGILFLIKSKLRM